VFLLDLCRGAGNRLIQPLLGSFSVPRGTGPNWEAVRSSQLIDNVVNVTAGPPTYARLHIILVENHFIARVGAKAADPKHSSVES
jgi:hypothetical protein